MGFFDRLANAWNIFVTSLLFIFKDKSLLLVPIILVFTTLLFCALFIYLLFNPQLVFALILNLILFILFMYIWTTFLASAQAWMVYEVAQGKDTTLFSGLKRSIKNIFDIILFALAKLFIAVIVGSIKRKYGSVGRMTGGFIESITGIAGKLVIPAMIITERNFIESIKQLGQAVKTIPEIAAFEVGIRPLSTFVTLISAAIGVLFWFAYGPTPAIIVFGFLFLLNTIFTILINQIYYTLLYLTLIEKKKIKGLKLSK